MQPLPLVTLPAKSLREPSQVIPVAEITTPEFQSFLDQLAHTMTVADGVGIAAPQVGKNIRAIVVASKHGPACYINPEITKASEAMTESPEGCLSVPGKYGLVDRHKKVTVKALDRHGRNVEMDLRNFEAIVFQHEIDHTNGILFIDKAKKVIEDKAAKHI